jgi:hypothetical protein
VSKGQATQLSSQIEVVRHPLALAKSGSLDERHMLNLLELLI